MRLLRFIGRSSNAAGRAPDPEAGVERPTGGSHPQLGRVGHGLVSTGVGAYAFLDDLFVGPIIVALAAWLPALVVFAGAAAALFFVNVACCNWLQRGWEIWIIGHGAKLEARLEKWRHGRLLRHPVGWITRGGVIWFTIAAGLIGAVIVVAVARLAGGQPIDHRRVTFASVAYSVGFAATYAVVGFGIGDLVRFL